jgi:hypothetical protein
MFSTQEIPWQLTSFMAINGVKPNPRSAFQYHSLCLCCG